MVTMMKIFRLTAFATIAANTLFPAIGLPGTSGGDMPAVSVLLVMDKNEYLLDEHLWVDVLIMNGTDEVAALPPLQSGAGQFRFILTNQNGDTVPENPPLVVSCPQRSPDEEVAPGDTLYSLRNLLETFGDHLGWPLLVNTLSTGSYELQAVYDGKYLSNRLMFKVIEPVGGETDAHELLMSGLDLLRQMRYEGAVEQFQSLVDKHPNSVYAPRAYIEMSSAYHIGLRNLDKRRDIAILILTKYGTSGSVSRALGNLIVDSGDAARPLIDSLRATTTSLRFRKLAEQAERDWF